MQTMLLDRHVALAINVKATTLERLARCSGAQVAPHLDHLSEANVMRCERFHVEDVAIRKISGSNQATGVAPVATAAAGASTAGGSNNVAPGDQAAAGTNVNSPRVGNAMRRKTLMHIEGTCEGLGCAVLLRGAPEAELFRLKRIMRFAAFAAYCARLEVAFCADVFLSLAATLAGGGGGVAGGVPVPAEGDSPADVAPPALGEGDTQVRSWQAWATALGERSLSEDRPVLSVSPYVQKWQVDDSEGTGGDNEATGGYTPPAASAPQSGDEGAGGNAESAAANPSGVATGGAGASPAASDEAEHQEMARVYYEHTTQVCSRC